MAEKLRKGLSCYQIKNLRIGFLVQKCNFDVLQHLECPKPVQHSLCYISKHLLSPSGRAGAVKAGEDPFRLTPPIGKIHPFSKIAVTFEPIMQF